MKYIFQGVDFSQLWSRNQTNCLRGIAAIIIVVFHVLIEWEMPRIVNLASSVAVAVFLFLSGFGIHESYKKYGLEKYWLKKFKRIIIPYTLFITVLLPFKSDFDLKAYILDITYIDSSYWFISYLIRCYLLYWVIQRFFPNKLFLLYFIGCLVSLNVFMQLEAEQSFSFFAGILASYHIERLRATESRWFYKVATYSFLIGVFFLLLKEIPWVHSYKGTLIYHYILLMIKLPIAIPILILPTIFPLLIKSRLLYLCGISSLEVYLVHLALLDYCQMNCISLFFYLLFSILLIYFFYQFNQLLMRYIR